MRVGATVEEGLEELLFLGFHLVRAGLGKEEVKREMEDTCRTGLREEVGNGKNRRSGWTHAPGSPADTREAGPFLGRKRWQVLRP